MNVVYLGAVTNSSTSIFSQAYRPVELADALKELAAKSIPPDAIKVKVVPKDLAAYCNSLPRSYVWDEKISDYIEDGLTETQQSVYDVWVANKPLPDHLIMELVAEDEYFETQYQIWLNDSIWYIGDVFNRLVRVEELEV